MTPSCLVPRPRRDPARRPGHRRGRRGDGDGTPCRPGAATGAGRRHPLRTRAARPTTPCSSIRCPPAPRSRWWPSTTSRSGAPTASRAPPWRPTTPSRSPSTRHSRATRGRHRRLLGGTSGPRPGPAPRGRTPGRLRHHAGHPPGPEGGGAARGARAELGRGALDAGLLHGPLPDGRAHPVRPPAARAGRPGALGRHRDGVDVLRRDGRRGALGRAGVRGDPDGRRR